MAVNRGIAILLAVLALAGCSAAVSEPRYLYPPAAPCPAIDPRRPVAPAAPLTGEFRPVSAAICTFEVVAMAGPDVGGGSWVWRSVRRTDGPLDELVGALRTPPTRQRGGGGGCPAMAQAPMFLALTDASGQAVVPAIPADPCGFRLDLVDRAVDALSWVTVDSR